MPIRVVGISGSQTFSLTRWDQLLQSFPEDARFYALAMLLMRSAHFSRLAAMSRSMAAM